MKHIEIQEFYKKVDDVVYRFWKYKWEKDWIAETTPYEEIPYQSVKKLKIK